MKINTEADHNDLTECSHDDKPSTGMFAVSDDIFSAVIGPTEPGSRLPRSCTKT